MLYRVIAFIRRMFAPVTLMLVPHGAHRGVSIRIPLVGLFIFVILCITGLGRVYALWDDARNYAPAKAELDDYKGKLTELQSTLSSLDEVNSEFRFLFDTDISNSTEVNTEFYDANSLDVRKMQAEIDKTITLVGEIRDYLSEARDQFRSVPLGWPVRGNLSSGYGFRTHPLTGARDFHTAIDISTAHGTPVRATADGIIVFSGVSGANGNLVAIEHGFGYRTFYAHNTRNAVRVGQVVKRGDVISYVGSTGRSTGAHLHYEVWRNGRTTNPMPYVKGDDWEILSAGKK